MGSWIRVERGKGNLDGYRGGMEDGGSVGLGSLRMGGFCLEVVKLGQLVWVKSKV